MAIKNFGATGHAFKAENFEQAAENMRKNNIKYIQLTPPKITQEFDWSKSYYTPAAARYMKEKLDGIHISSLGCYIDMCAEDDAFRQSEVERFKKNIELAKYIGADIIATETGRRDMNDTIKSEEAFKRALKSAEEIARCAEKFGVTVGIEAVISHSVSNVDLLKKFMDETDSPNMCCLFDPVGLMNESNIDEQYGIIDRYFELFSDRIRLIHLKDVDVIDGKTKIVPVGTGKIDFDYLFKKIDENLNAIDLIVESVNSEYITEGMKYFEKYMQGVN